MKELTSVEGNFSSLEAIGLDENHITDRGIKILVYHREKFINLRSIGLG